MQNRIFMKIIEQIDKLKKEKNAVILAHNYQLPEIQDIADFVGDSLGLSIQAKNTNADIIVFCGVYFMAETAKILSPQKKVLLPDKDAGCPMADMIDLQQLRELKQKHPGSKVMCYVNSTAEVKAECDICCTSANAVSIAKNYFHKNDRIIFIPDKYLAQYIQFHYHIHFITWHGYCPAHVQILPDNILRQKEKHPDALVLVHPECTPYVMQFADKVLSTEGMCQFSKNAEVKEFIIGTETGILHRLRKENPDKRFYPASIFSVCPNMKKINLEKVLWSLEENHYEVHLPEDVISKAAVSIKNMLQFSGISYANERVK